MEIFHNDEGGFDNEMFHFPSCLQPFVKTKETNIYISFFKNPFLIMFLKCMHVVKASLKLSNQKRQVEGKPKAERLLKRYGETNSNDSVKLCSVAGFDIAFTIF